MAKARYIELTDDLRDDICASILRGESKRSVMRRTGVGWRIITKALAQTEARRMPKADGVIGRSDEVNTKRVNAMLRFVRTLRFTDQSAGAQVVELDPNAFQKQAIRQWYGPMRNDGSGRRYVNLGAMSVPKRNGKTILCSAITLAHMIGPEAAPNSKIVAVAENMPQAKILYDYIQDMARNTPGVGVNRAETPHGRLRFTGGNRPRVYCVDNGVELHIMPGTYNAISGMTINMFIIDEYALHSDANALYALKQSQGSIDEPFGVVISTKSDVPGNPMAQLIERWKRVEDGVEEANGFDMILLGIEEGEDWEDPAVWRRVNPGMPHSPKIEQFYQMAAEARQNELAKRKFIVFNLNGDISAADALFKYELWREGVDRSLSLNALRGEPCYGGLDLSQSDDLTSFALWFPTSNALFSYSWLPASVVDDRTATDHISYRKWVDEGSMFVAGEKAVGYAEVIEAVSVVCAELDVKAVAYDRWNFGNFRDALDTTDWALPPFVEFAQNFGTLGPAINRFEELLFKRELRHPANPVLDLAVKYTGYRVGQMNAGARIPQKMSTTVKIDPCVAAIMAVGLSTRLLDAEVRNVWGPVPEGGISWA